MNTERKKLLKYVVISDEVKVCAIVKVSDITNDAILCAVHPIEGICPNFKPLYHRKFASVVELREVLVAARNIPCKYELSDVVINPLAMIREISAIDDGLLTDLSDMDTNNIELEVMDNRLYIHDQKAGYVLRFKDGEWGSNTYSSELISDPRE